MAGTPFRQELKLRPEQLHAGDATLAKRISRMEIDFFDIRDREFSMSRHLLSLIACSNETHL